MTTLFIIVPITAEINQHIKSIGVPMAPLELLRAMFPFNMLLFGQVAFEKLLRTTASTMHTITGLNRR